MSASAQENTPFRHRACIVAGLFLLFLLHAPLPAVAQDLPCRSCHEPPTAEETIHPAVQMGCTLCHLDSHGKAEPELSLLMGTPDLCLMCHDQQSFSESNVHAPVEAGLCTVCHDPHSSAYPTLLIDESPGLCFQCHDQQSFSESSVHAPVEAGSCTVCHEPHSSAHPKLLVGESPELCFQCHDQQSFSESSVHAPVEAGLCAVCHEPHSSAYPTLLVGESPELCFRCHGERMVSQRVVHPPVSEGRCGSCHAVHASENDNLLLDPAGELCVTCHGGQADGVHVLVGFGLGDNHPVQGREDPSRPGTGISCVSCHKPHSSDSSFLFTTDTTEPESLCLRCHRKTRVELE